MSKTEVYSWRLPPSLKIALEEAAREEGVSVAALLERAARRWLARPSSGKRAAEEIAAEEVLRSRAMRFVGAIAGGEPRRAENARQQIGARLRKRNAR